MHVAYEKILNLPVSGTTHGTVVWLSRHPLRSLMQNRAHCCECG